jgi:alpha-ketoglutarate-dependent taurine dioxygenase
MSRDTVLADTIGNPSAEKRYEPHCCEGLDLLRVGQAADGLRIPLVYMPRSGHLELSWLIEWLTLNRSYINARILEHGAVLFRHFAVLTPNDFKSVVSALTDNLVSYAERSSPRTQVLEKVYTSTDYPSKQTIFPHNEHSYSLTYPLKLFFGCITPATSGGETPIGSVRRITQLISHDIRERFRKRGYMYVRNFGDGLGLPWQTAFQTSDKSAVEAYCRRTGIIPEWKSGDRLRTRQVRPTFVTHPKTGESLWFNHMTFFHVTTLDEAMCKVLRSEFADEDLPNNTYYGDGSPVEPETLDQLRRAYVAEMQLFQWERGDLLVLDNVLTTHARSPYVGTRKILVSMAEPVTRTDITTL